MPLPRARYKETTQDRLDALAATKRKMTLMLSNDEETRTFEADHIMEDGDLILCDLQVVAIRKKDYHGHHYEVVPSKPNCVAPWYYKLEIG